MLFRFSAYGFLKNLRLFDAFLLLALLDRGFDYLTIGTLVACREVALVALEVPSGAIADTFGRRRCMVLSMACYVAAGLLLWRCDGFAPCALAMSLHGIGDAFRSGTHKALILEWLRQQGRLGERTRVYGFTRSWSQLGSACSALAGGALLLLEFDYRTLFLAGATVSALNLINLATYPRSLDVDPEQEGGAGGRTVAAAYRKLVGVLVELGRASDLRAGMMLGVAVHGCHKTAKDYLQPLLAGLVVALPLSAGWSEAQRTGLLVGVASAAMFLLASFASRQAHRYEALFGDARRCARALVSQFALVIALLAAALWCELPLLAVGLFVLFTVGHNLWRPVLVGWLGSAGASGRAATVLSLESQGGALAAAVFAPAIGALVDLVADGATPTPVGALAPLGLLLVPLLLARLVARGARGGGAAGQEP